MFRCVCLFVWLPLSVFGQTEVLISTSSKSLSFPNYYPIWDETNASTVPPTINHLSYSTTTPPTTPQTTNSTTARTTPQTTNSTTARTTPQTTNSTTARTTPQTTNSTMAPTSPQTTNSTMAPTSPQTTNSTMAPTSPQTTNSTMAPTSPQTTNSTMAPTSPQTTNSTMAPTSPQTTNSTMAPTSPQTTNSTTAPTTPQTTNSTTSTPTTPPMPDVGDYVVRAEWNSSACVMARMGLQFSIRMGDGFQTINLDPSPNVTNTSGTCGNNGSDSALTLTSDKVTVQFSFTNQSSKFFLSAVRLTVMDGSGTNFTVENSTLSLWEASLGSSYMCKKEQSFNITDALIVNTFELQVQPFGVMNDKFSTAHECSVDDTSLLIPIIVGAALAILILIVVIAYVIGRRKTYVGYQTL